MYRISKAANTLLYVVNTPDFFLSHRLPLALEARSRGFDVHIATADGPESNKIVSLGFNHHVVPFGRSTQNPICEIRTICSLIRLFLRVNPAIVHLVTIKPVLYGGIASRITGVRAVVHAISGLGTVFLAKSLFARARRFLIVTMYRIALKHERQMVIFQNPDDRDALLNLKAFKKEQARMIRGSGVKIVDYPLLPQPRGKTVVVMAARLLKDKGVFEYIQAARLLQDRGLAVEMRLIGSPDPGNPSSVTQQELDHCESETQVKLLGFRNDIAAEYVAANIVCLPSYREGLPKSLVEAAACGRAVVTTDVPGCRDAIIPGVTGLLVPVKDAIALADAIQRLIEDPELRNSMGQAGRALAEEAFTIEKIVGQHMEIYRDLIQT